MDNWNTLMEPEVMKWTLSFFVFAHLTNPDHRKWQIGFTQPGVESSHGQEEASNCHARAKLAYGGWFLFFLCTLDVS